MSNENKIIAAICLFFFIIIGFLFWKGPSLSQPSQEAKNPDILVRDNSHMTGKKGAKVTMVEFADYQCPACATINVEIKKVLDKYALNPHFNFVTRNFPLSQHKNAIIAAEAVESAGAQDKYLEMGNMIYEKQAEWSESADTLQIFIEYARSLGIDTIKFRKDMEEHNFMSKINSDTVDGQSLQIDHTPTVFINGIEQRDLSFEAIKKTVDNLLAQ